MENTSVGTLGFLQGKGPLSQIVLAVVLSALLYIILISLEAVYISYQQVSRTKVSIDDRTLNSENNSDIYSVNPQTASANKRFRDLRVSDNERTGIEYSYSCFLLINESSFEDGTTNLKHIFSKGNERLYPLLSPGVFLLSNKNTLRIFQNSSKTWYNKVDVDNIPIGKWFHLVVLAKNNAVEVYVNGNLASKLNMMGGIIYQNYQNLSLFSRRKVDLKNANMRSIPSTDEAGYHGFKVDRSMNGLISRFNYFSYALSYTQIRDLMNEGPNPITAQENQDKPPYFIDNWWTGKDLLM